jgi:putative alpha-1,2-mannosidase
LQSAALASLGAGAPGGWVPSLPKNAGEAFPETAGLARFVDVFIGTGGHGHTYPGATVPFGMAQLSPETWNGDWDHCSGYHFDDTLMMGFSHTHLSGTGIGDLLDVLVMPAVGPVRTEPGPRDHPRLFDRASVHLGDGRVLTIAAVGNGKAKPYIQSVTWNGRTYEKSWFSHADVVQGGTFVFQMGGSPKQSFGAAAASRPPSFVLTD